MVVTGCPFHIHTAHAHAWWHMSSNNCWAYVWCPPLYLWQRIHGFLAWSWESGHYFSCQILDPLSWIDDKLDITYSRIVPAPSVSPWTLPPAMVIIHPWEPPERPESPLPWLHQETSSFWGEPWDSPPPYQTPTQSEEDQTVVTPGVPFHLPCPICQQGIERAEIHHHGKRNVIRQGSEVDLCNDASNFIPL